MIKFIKNIKIFKSYKINVKNIDLKSPFVLIIDFTANDVHMYLTIHGDYRAIRSKFLKRRAEIKENESISFMEYKEEIGLLIPVEDVIKQNKKKWITKPM